MLHKYQIAEQVRAGVEHDNAEERNAYEAAQRLVALLCERLSIAWGSSAVLSVANNTRCAQSYTDASSPLESLSPLGLQLFQLFLLL